MRKKYIDFLRAIAIFYMFFYHAFLVLFNPDVSNKTLNFIFELVPFCPALFLFLAGFSITFYFEKNNTIYIENKYFFSLIKRGLILIFCAMLLFFIEHGLQFPDFLFASGILNSIGWMIIISALFLLISSYRILFLSIFVAILIIITIIFEKNKIFFVPFNYGYEPMSPTIIYGFIGFLFGNIFYSIKDLNKQKVFISLSGISGLFISIFYTIKDGFLNTFFSDKGRYVIERIFSEKMLPNNLFSSMSNLSFYREHIWNYNTDCFIYTLGFVLVLFAFGYFIENILQKYLPKLIFLPGTFAFANYFYHLIFLALLVVLFGYGFFNLTGFLIIMLLLYVLSYVLSFIIYKIKLNKKKK